MEYADSRITVDVVTESFLIPVSYDTVFNGASNIPPAVPEYAYP
jgi:hypothetical protein